jgi:glutamyl-tRNA synthetase
MILGSDKSRLSKRHGATSLEDFAAEGILPAGMMNYLALLGWSLDGKTEFFTPKKLVEAFSLKRVGSNPSVFDPEKLAWLSGEHFTRLSLEEKVAGVEAHLRASGVELPPAGEALTEILTELVKLLGKRLKSFPEVDRGMGLAHFFRDLPDYDGEAVTQHLGGEATGRLAALAERLETLEPFEAKSIEEALRAQAETRKLKAGELIHPLRVAVTGQSASPDIFKICELLGRPRVLLRLEPDSWTAGA